MISDLNAVYRREPALYEVDFDSAGFVWVDSHNREASLLGYIRRAKDPNDFVLVFCNFTPTVHHEYRLGVPVAGNYKEIFNSDSQFYGGTNIGNGMGLASEPIEAQGREHSIKLSIPPMGVVMFKLG